jgi:GNAT superfamily N-acetyltransferase
VTDLTVSTAEDAAEEAAIRAALAKANAEAGWPHAPAPLRVALRDAAGGIVGGLVGAMNWRWLWIQVLAMPPALRGQGHGARLLAAAEAAAQEAGCVGARLDTYSFQARGFYEKQGYALTGEIATARRARRATAWRSGWTRPRPPPRPPPSPGPTPPRRARCSRSPMPSGKGRGRRSRTG